jgi:hypothetical protein
MGQSFLPLTERKVGNGSAGNAGNRRAIRRTDFKGKDTPFHNYGNQCGRGPRGELQARGSNQEQGY